MGRIPDAMGPDGIYCGACPSFGRTCRGCGSEDMGQKRTSKWGCRIRRCCLEERGLDLCSSCDEMPCGTYERRLLRDHRDDPRFRYRREAPLNLRRMGEVGIDAWLEEMDTRYRCPQCGGRVHWYHYRCSDCGLEDIEV